MAKKILSYIKLLGTRVRIYVHSGNILKSPGKSSLKYAQMGAVCVLVAGLLIGGVSYFLAQKPVMLLADGKVVGLVGGRHEVEVALETARQELSRELETEISTVTSQLSYQEDCDRSGELLAGEKLVAVLKKELAWPINTWAIEVNGERVLYLASETEAENALAELKKYYLPQEESADSSTDALKIEKVEFLDQVQVVPGKSVPEQIMTVAEAVEAMVKGLEKIVPHVVEKGESLWTIARDHGLTVAELQEINPSLKGELLQIGQELNLKKAEPLVNVVSTWETTVEEEIPYKVVYEDDASLWKGQEKVKQSGKKGSRIVTYHVTQTNNQITDKQTLAENIIEEPAAKVVRKGTKLIVASRSSGGNGILGWPLRGTITSPYGKRGGSTHTGLDIDGDTGDPVAAAEDGTVVRASTYGTYGKCVDINHGQGLVTRYAHLSKIEVSVGQKVSRGDLIGRVGSTGRSTGSHLHFEVIENGKHASPQNFLK
ncbi:MAG: peptidoglycan DD-metalloendopeptidase family protein [Peptococcia bacterium]|jgi:murein DD-endopeptidase MepM/ murein hydrolase activator NlpD